MILNKMKRKKFKSYISLKQRITAAFMVAVMLLQICVPTVALAATAWGTQAEFNRQLQLQLESGLFSRVENTAADDAYKGAYYIYQEPQPTTNLLDFYRDYNQISDSPVIKMVGDTFVQTRLIRSQIKALLGRFLLQESIAPLTVYAAEAQKINELYVNGKTYGGTGNNKIPMGTPLAANASVAADMIWPEVRTIATSNGDVTVLVPVVHLSQATMESKVDGHDINLFGDTKFAGLTLSEDVLLTGGNNTITGVNGIINNGGNIQALGNITLSSSGTIANLGGVFSATGNLKIVADNFYNKTLVVPYKDKNGEGTKIGRVAKITGASIEVTAADGITFEGASAVSTEGTLTLSAENDINILPVQTGSSGQSQSGHWEINKSTTDLLMSRLVAEDTLSLIAGGVINITASELISTRGGIELLAKNGIHILDELEQTTIQKEDRKGKTTGTSSEFRTEAVRAILKAGKGVLLDSDFGDVTLRATEITSTEGAQVNAKNGKVHLLMTKELEEFHLQTVRKGTWTIKTRTEDVIHENNIQNAIVGGLKVKATYGINVEYTGKEGATLKEQIEEYRKMPEMKWMAELYDDALAKAGTKLNWQELEEIHKEIRKTNKTLSPAAMAIIAIAVAVVTAGAGAALLGVQGTAYAGMANAALTTIATQATQSLAVGDSPGETLKKLGSKESIKNLAVSVATAGAMQNIPDVKIFEVANTSTISAANIANQAAQAMVNATVTAGISMAVNGGNSDTFKQMFIQSVAMDAINFVGEKLANKIGDASKLPKDQRISVGAKYISHAALGCMTGALTSQLNDADRKLGCSSGAGGAVIGEYVGSLYADKLDQEMKEWIDESIKEDGVRPSFEQQQEKFDYFKAKGVDMARLAAALTAFGTGGDVNVAANSGQNAAQNNALDLVMALKSYLELNGNGDWYKGLAAVGAGEDLLSRMSSAIDAKIDEYGREVFTLVASGHEQEIELLSLVLTKMYEDSALGKAEAATAQLLTAGITVVYESSTGKVVREEWNKLSIEDQNALRGAGKILEVSMDVAARGRVSAMKNMIELPAVKDGQLNVASMMGDPDHGDWDKVNTSDRDRVQSVLKYGKDAVWSLDPKIRGRQIESYLTSTDYKNWQRADHLLDPNTGKPFRSENFPLIDFQYENNVTSLKSVNTKGSSWGYDMKAHINTLSSTGIEVNGVPAKKFLDIRVQPGGYDDAQFLVQYGAQRNIIVVIKEFGD